MFNVERYQEILDILKEKKTVTVAFLAKRLFSSEATIRRDLTSLEEQGYIRRVFGGAVLLEGFDFEAPLSLRESEHEEEKNMICRMAAALIKDSDSIILDSSSTLLKMVKFFVDKSKLRVLTNGLKTAQFAVEFDTVKLYCTGGEFRENSMSFVGRKAEEFIAEYNADTLFFSCKGISLEKGLTEVNEEEIRLRRTMMSCSKKRVLVADHSKFDNVCFCRLGALNEIDCLVTDRKPTDKYMEYFQENNVEAIFPKTGNVR